jgi:D-alanyl-lipoteichoic acid acyltransferase DltB (MBOAT superfamily)
MAFIPVYLFILFVLIIIDYLSGILIERSQDNHKKWFLVLCIISTCSALFTFKYFNFFNNSAAAIASLLHWNYPIPLLNIILPIGLSFHTFQSLSYVIEVYRGNQKAEKHFGIYALFVMFYPQLVAGPIERPQNLLHQFYEHHNFDYARVTNGLKLMAWGLFKKIVIADRLAIAVDQVYGHPTEYSGLALIIATIFFAFQIYCDFSGYSDIAIGAAQVLGFKLMDNFKRPYFSKSISEFWKRWHISLSSWFRDYLYIPLGGNRVPKWRWQFNLIITFLVSGLWHGANWTFVIWGALHGFYLISAIWTKDIRGRIEDLVGLSKHEKIDRTCKTIATFALVCFAWIFFRASNVSQAWYIVTHLLSGAENWINFDYHYTTILSLGLDPENLQIALLSLGLLGLISIMQRNNEIRRMLSHQPVYIRWSIYYAVVVFTILYGVFSKDQFIYFQF